MDLVILFLVGGIIIYAVNKYTKSKLCPNCNSKDYRQEVELSSDKDSIIKAIKDKSTRYIYRNDARYENTCNNCGQVWYKDVSLYKSKDIYNKVIKKYEEELEQERKKQIEEESKKYRKQKEYYKIK